MLLTPGDLNQLVQAIGSGGQAAMAIALKIAESLADADYKLTPQLADNLTATLNQGAYRNLQISQLLRLKLIHLHLRKL